MGSISHALSSSTRPISTAEFVKSLYRVLSIGKSKYEGKQQLGTIGLAISGGVDSMALAVLCSQLRKSRYVKYEVRPIELEYFRNISFKAFIVDHQVRSGSYEEAKAVSSVLEKQGISSEILKIDWPKDHSSNSSNFESLARKYRFRLLGKACLDSGINSLLLAHHEDDQVETIMMRLIAGHRREGLVGIKEQGGIPECYGMHGVYESGGLQNSTLTYPQQSRYPPLPKQIDIETGGIKIYRPMLGFSKDRLIATCKHEKMEWFEDHTNKDPTLTKRNAIRHMYSSHSMPASLSKPALLDLSRRMKASVSHEDASVTFLLSKSTINSFNTRTGTVKVRLPTAVDIHAASIDAEVDCKRIAAKLLRRVLFLVSPLEHIELASLDGTVTQIFPGLSDPQEQTISPKSLTVASVYLQPEQEKRNPSPEEISKQSEQPQRLLSRQPYSNSSEFPMISIPTPDSNTWTPWTPWQLFDGRYWIRIRHRRSNCPSLIIRPFQPSDRKTFIASLDQDERRYWNTKTGTSASAKGDIRWTLPALVVRDPLSDSENVIALPTLGYHSEYTHMWLEWQVRYKKVESDLPLEFA